MLNVTQAFQQRLLAKRQADWLREQVATYRANHPQATAQLSDEELGQRIERLLATAAEQGVTLEPNQHRFAAIAFQLDDDGFHLSQPWAVTVFGWDCDENLKLSTCEQHLAEMASGSEG